MKKNILSLLVIFAFQLQAQEMLNTELLGNLTYSEELSDIWGYEKNGSEYALVGVYDGISVVDVTIPSQAQELAFFPGDPSIWRDLKTYGDYLYCINETGGGLQIVNLSEVIAGDSIPTYIERMNLGFSTAHNIYIDENGVLYVFGSNYGNGGCGMYDLTVDPENPVFLGVFDDYYLHDGMVRGDTLWGGAVYAGVFSVVDVSDKSNPEILASQATPNTFSHNCWISDDGNYLFTTDEVSGAYVAAYDVSDLSDIEELDRIQAWSGYANVIPHNTHVNGDFIVTSYYRDGLSIVDVSHPSNMVEVAYYDTSDDFEGNGFNGAWGAYPWLPSGNILVSDMETGLYIIQPKHTNAAFVEGEVTDEVTGMPISNVTVQIIGSVNPDLTDIQGVYATGMANSGTYQIVYSAPGYADFLTEITIESAEVLVFDVQLAPLGLQQVQFSVVEESDASAVAQATVVLISDDTQYNFYTDENGFIATSIYEGTYDLLVTQWGYQSHCGTVEVAGPGFEYSIALEAGYQDDFSTDLGWLVESDNSVTAGEWERVVPVASYFDGQLLNPEADAGDGCRDFAYVTFNAEGLEYYEGDLDGGYTRIISPMMDLTTYSNPSVNFSTWFVNTGGNGVADDALLVSLSNGIETIGLFQRTESNTSDWLSHTVYIDSLFELTDQMQLIVETMDLPASGHLVEAGFDNFSIQSSPLSVGEIDDITFDLYPNPSLDGQLNITVAQASKCVVTDARGAHMVSFDLEYGHNSFDLSNLSSAAYLISISNDAGTKTEIWLKK